MEFKYIGEKIYYVPPQMEAHFKKNPLSYALALEGGGLKDKDIRRGLRKLFSLKITNQVMKHMIKLPKNESNREKWEAVKLYLERTCKEYATKAKAASRKPPSSSTPAPPSMKRALDEKEKENDDDDDDDDDGDVSFCVFTVDDDDVLILIYYVVLFCV